ncbi:F-box protein SKIP17-like [Phalaenopsis equestris]|uniref:F-box protein SKIP17-like n=1 Tax=Phalaenopsis equestris TaxID=78828 RepID=UPI0009E23606|nr:F-box protein SKIP17-like [Phalaenopsis equestris]
MEALLPSSSSSKRSCSGDISPIGDTTVLPNSATIDGSMASLLGLRDPSVSIDLSLQRILDLTAQDLEKEKLIENAMRVASAIHEAAIRSARRRASIHNAASWPLPSDLTVKVFSILDTRSLCQAAAACSMFSKCAGDPLCYCNIDLTAKDPKINNTVVSTMIQRAGKALKSLKLGIWPKSVANEDVIRSSSYSSRNSTELLGLSWSERRPRQGKEPCILTRSCLLALSADGSAAGAHLRSLHLHNIDKMDGPAFAIALSVCPSLLDLKVVGLHIELRQILEFLSAYCHSIEQLFVESLETGCDDSLKSQTCADLVNGCPQIISLTLRGFKLNDHKVRILIKGLANLKLVDFSTSYSISGVFLRNLVNGSNAHSLEVLILRDCLHLKELEVARFLSALISGDCKLLRYLDISNKDGLSSEDDWNVRCYSPSIPPLSRILEARPDLCLLADFPPDECCMDIEQISDEEVGSDSGLQFENDQILNPDYLDSSDSSYSSNLASGSEDAYDTNYAFYDGDNLDELEFQFNY